MGNDTDYYALFGLDAPEEEDAQTGAEEQELADPAHEDVNDEGAEEQEAADPADVDEDNDNSDGTGEESETDEPEEKSDAEYAKMRRKAEADAEKKAKKDLEKLIEELGIVGDDGKIIKAVDELKAKVERDRAEKAAKSVSKIRESLEYAGVDEEIVESVVEAMGAKEELERIKEEREQERIAREREAFDRDVKEQLKFIGKFDPSIKTVEDFAKMDNFEEFREYVMGGADFATAYVRSHSDAIAKRPTPPVELPKNVNASKSHLTTAKSKTGDIADLTDAEYREFLVWNPKMTRAEAAKYMAKYKRQTGGK